MPLMLFLGLLCLVFLVIFGALRPTHTTLSHFELQRRKALGDRQAVEALRRERLLAKAATLGPLVTGILFILLTVALTGALGWGRGVLGALVLALLCTHIVRLSAVKKLANSLAKKYETPVLDFIEKYPLVTKLLGGKPFVSRHDVTFGSRQEVLHAIETSRNLFSDEESKLMNGAISLKERTAGELMTAREDIVTIPQDELLGPLVLSDLYKTGHSSFPVVQGDIDHVVGLLDIRSLLTLESEFTVVAAMAMTPDMLSIPAAQTLRGAMMLFLRSGQQLALVTDEAGTTIGLLSLNDILSVLFGRH